MRLSGYVSGVVRSFSRRQPSTRASSGLSTMRSAYESVAGSARPARAARGPRRARRGTRSGHRDRAQRLEVRRHPLDVEQRRRRRPAAARRVRAAPPSTRPSRDGTSTPPRRARRSRRRTGRRRARRRATSRRCGPSRARAAGVGLHERLVDPAVRTGRVGARAHHRSNAVSTGSSNRRRCFGAATATRASRRAGSRHAGRATTTRSGRRPEPHREQPGAVRREHRARLEVRADAADLPLVRRLRRGKRPRRRRRLDRHAAQHRAVLPGRDIGAIVGRHRRREVGLAHQPPVDRRGARTALGDRPDDQALTAAHVAAHEHAVDVRRPLLVPGDVAAIGDARRRAARAAPDAADRRSPSRAARGRRAARSRCPRSSRTSSARRRTSARPRGPAACARCRRRRRRSTRC